MSNLRRDGVEVDEQALRWLGTFAASKNSVHKLRAAYNRMPLDRAPQERAPPV